MKEYIDIIPNYPKDGITFYDLNNLYINHFGKLVKGMSELIGELKFDMIVGLGSRGYILGAGLANELGVNFLPASYNLHSKDYIQSETTSEYATKIIKMPNIDLDGKSIIIVDDVIATGNSIKAVLKLSNSLKAETKGVFGILDIVDFKKDFAYNTLIKV